MNKWVIGILIAIIILGGGYFLFNKSNKTQVPAPTQQIVQPTSTATTPTTASATGTLLPTATTTAKTITVTGTEYAFAPATITAKVGQPVTVMFKNNGTYPHNFTITELGVHSETIQPGQTTTITFTPTKMGSFTYECTVPGHADRGMKGTLTVQ